jgi:uncharacterized coiled-coil protein SlyX
MPKYIPMYGKLTPASIPQVVAYIQDYLRDNHIPTVDAMAQLIAEFLADHPELVAVASVNSKTGEVVLTGADIMINSSNNVSIATQIININIAIADHLARIVTAEQNIETLQDDNTEINSAITNLTAQTSELETAISEIDGELQESIERIETLEEKTATNESSIAEINTTLTNHNRSINQNTTNYNLLSQEVNRLKQTTVNLSYTLEELNGYFESVTSGITVELQSGGGSFSRLGNVIIGRLHLKITGSPDADGWYKFRVIVPVPQNKFSVVAGVANIDSYSQDSGCDYGQYVGQLGFIGYFKTKNQYPYITFTLLVR